MLCINSFCTNVVVVFLELNCTFELDVGTGEKGGEQDVLVANSKYINFVDLIVQEIHGVKYLHDVLTVMDHSNRLEACSQYVDFDICRQVKLCEDLAKHERTVIFDTSISVSKLKFCIFKINLHFVRAF